MFDLLGDLADGLGKIVGTVTGSVIGLSVGVVATALGITTSMVQEALDAGCTSYEDIRNYFDL
jgi:capsular polysaccharide biosynthesis protein